MAAANFFQIFAEDLCSEAHFLFGTTDTLRAYLTNNAPSASLDADYNDLLEIAAGSGYTAGGEDINNNATRTTNVVTVTAVDVVWTATGGTIGPFQYVVIKNDIAGTTMGDPLILWYDYGSAITLQIGETFTLDFGASFLTVTVG